MTPFKQRLRNVERTAEALVPPEGDGPAPDQLSLAEPHNMGTALADAARLVYNDPKSSGVAKARELTRIAATAAKLKPLLDAEQRQEVDWEERRKQQDAMLAWVANDPRGVQVTLELTQLSFELARLAESHGVDLGLQDLIPGPEKKLARLDAVPGVVLDEFFIYLREKYGSNEPPAENEPEHD